MPGQGDYGEPRGHRAGPPDRVDSGRRGLKKTPGRNDSSITLKDGSVYFHAYLVAKRMQRGPVPRSQ